MRSQALARVAGDRLLAPVSESSIRVVYPSRLSEWPIRGARADNPGGRRGRAGGPEGIPADESETYATRIYVGDSDIHRRLGCNRRLGCTWTTRTYVDDLDNVDDSDIHRQLGYMWAARICTDDSDIRGRLGYRQTTRMYRGIPAARPTADGGGDDGPGPAHRA